MYFFCESGGLKKERKVHELKKENLPCWYFTGTKLTIIENYFLCITMFKKNSEKNELKL